MSINKDGSIEIKWDLLPMPQTARQRMAGRKRSPIIHVTVPPGLYEDLVTLAYDNHTTISAIGRACIIRHLDVYATYLETEGAKRVFICDEDGVPLAEVDWQPIE